MRNRGSKSKASAIVNFLSVGLMLIAAAAVQAQSPVTPPGAGTELDPYLISELGHLVWMGDTVSSSSGIYYTMTADIDASETANWNGGFAPIGTSSVPFTGIFDGDGHTINGLVINRPSTSCVGLFGKLGGEVRNLGIEGGAVTAYYFTGSLAGLNYGGAVFNCHSTATVIGNDAVGGLVGSNYGGTVSNSFATGAVTGDEQVGGLVGTNFNGTVSNSYATSAVSGTTKVGGLVGENNGDISDCHATGEVTGTADVIGGLVGDNSGPVSNCDATGAVTGGSYVGGLAGYNGGSMSNCYATGAVTATSNQVGGLVGRNYGGTVSNCYATGTVTGSSDYVGGLVGYSSDTVSNCYATGAVTGEGNSVGGLVGYISHGTVSNCCATGAVAGAGDHVGGLIGYNHDGPVSNSYATGAVSGDQQVGGLVGTNYGFSGTVQYCYSSGPVMGNDDLGGLAGDSYYGTVSDSYWDKETSGQNSSIGGGEGKTTAEMMQQATFVGWDFTDIWNKTEGTTCPWLSILPPPFKLTVDSIGPGSVTIDPESPDGTYAAGTMVTLTATPSGPDAELARWLGTVPFDSPTVTIMMNIDRSVIARFRLRIEINSLADLAKIGNDPAYPLDAVYTLTADIDASETAGWNNGYGFEPIGSDDTPFTGIFEGNGHTITGLVINRPSWNYIGLFRVVGKVGEVGEVRNLGMIGGSVTGYRNVGGLVGYSKYSMVSNCYAGGAVTGDDYVGGLVGYDYRSTVSNCYTISEVTGADYVGGLVGYDNRSTVSDCYATGAVSGYSGVGGLVGYIRMIGTVSNCYATGAVAGAGGNVGGLVGFNDGSVSNCYASGDVTGDLAVGGLMGCNYYNVSNCYATGAVTGDDYVGGLVGYNPVGMMWNCYAIGAVSGVNRVGGLVGYNEVGTVLLCYATNEVKGEGDHVGGLAGYNFGGAVLNCYATGAVSGIRYVGGLVGSCYDEYDFYESTVSYCYATGIVTGESYVGGLVGYNGFYYWGTVSDSYWDIQTSGQSTSAGGTGKTTAEMMQQATFVDWDFTNIWGIVENESYPYLRSLYDPADAPVVSIAISYKTHGTAGEFGINVLDGVDGNDIECRRYGVTKLVVGFDKYVQGVGGLDASDVTLSSGTVDAVTLVGGSMLTIEMSGTTNGEPLTVSLPGIANVLDEAVVCEDSLCIRQLVGDISPDGVITALDRIKVRDAMSQAVDASNFRADVHADGVFTALDRVVTRDAMTTGFVGSCP